MVSTHLKNIRQTGNLPQVGVNIKNIWTPPRSNLKRSICLCECCGFPYGTDESGPAPWFSTLTRLLLVMITKHLGLSTCSPLFPPNNKNTVHPGRLTGRNLLPSPTKRKENSIWTKPPGDYVPAVNLRGGVVPPKQWKRVSILCTKLLALFVHILSDRPSLRWNSAKLKMETWKWWSLSNKIYYSRVPYFSGSI